MILRILQQTARPEWDRVFYARRSSIFVSIEEIISNKISEIVETHLSERLSPIEVLRDFEGVEVLTLDEAAKVLRQDKEVVRAAAHRREIPHRTIGRSMIFPKRLLVEYLTGVWESAERPALIETDKRKRKILRFVS
jgi:excisionase family DNA binding protein